MFNSQKIVVFGVHLEAQPQGSHVSWHRGGVPKDIDLLPGPCEIMQTAEGKMFARSFCAWPIQLVHRDGGYAWAFISMSSGTCELVGSRPFRCTLIPDSLLCYWGT